MPTASSNIVPLRETSAPASRALVALRIDPPRISALFLLASIVIGALDLVTLGLDSTIRSEQLRRVFDVNEELSIPTWFSTLQFIVVAMLVGFVALVKAHLRDEFALLWGLLATIMLLLSMDEAATIHESGAQVLGKMGLGGDWVILGVVFAGVVGLFYVRFMLALPRAISALFVLAAGVLLGGALGVETIHLTVRPDDLASQGGVLASAEEFLERTGVAIMIFAVLVYVTDYMGIRGIALAEAAIDRPQGAASRAERRADATYWSST